MLIGALLAVLLVAAPAEAAPTGGRWPGKKITYSDTLPPSYDWVIKRAVRAWSKGSGAKVKFVRAPKGTRGQVQISFGPTQGAGGEATLGHHRNAYVHLSRNLPRNLPRSRWVSTAVLLAHELGHVLGLSHSAKASALMYPYTPEQPELGDGLIDCRWVTKPDANKLRKLYGGKVKLAPKSCLAEPRAPALRNVGASGGAATSTPVSLSWTAPGLPRESSLQVLVAVPGYCGSMQLGRFVAAYTLPATATSWTDPDGAAHATETLCYQVQALNYWGGGSAPYRTTR